MVANPTDVDLCAGGRATLRQTAGGFVVVDADGDTIYASGVATRAAWRDAVATWRDEEIGGCPADGGVVGEAPGVSARVLCTGANAVLWRDGDGRFVTAQREVGGAVWFPATDEGYAGAVEAFAAAEGVEPRRVASRGPVFDDNDDDNNDDDEDGEGGEGGGGGVLRGVGGGLGVSVGEPSAAPDVQVGAPSTPLSAAPGGTEEGMSPYDAPWLGGGVATRGSQQVLPDSRPWRPSTSVSVSDPDEDDEDGWGRFEGLSSVVAGSDEEDGRWFGWGSDSEEGDAGGVQAAPVPLASPAASYLPPGVARGRRDPAGGGGGEAPPVTRRPSGGRRVAVSATGTKKTLFGAVAVAVVAATVFFLTRSDSGTPAAVANPAVSATSLCSFVSKDPSFEFTVAPMGSPPTVAETAAEQKQVVALVAGYPPSAPSAATLRSDLAGFWQAAQAAPTAAPPPAAAAGVAAAEDSWPAIAGVCASG